MTMRTGLIGVYSSWSCIREPLAVAEFSQDTSESFAAGETAADTFRAA